MIKNLRNIIVVLFLMNHFSFHAQTKIIPYQELTNYNGVASGSGIYFGATMAPSGFTLTFAGPSDRWIAFGLGVPMAGADAFIYSCGNPGNIYLTDWKDYKNTSSGTVLDGAQNWTVVSSNVASGQRTVVAYRPLNTGDVNDAVISLSATSLDVIWARGATADYTIAYHGTTNRRGYINIPWQSAPTASFSANSTTVCQGSTISFNNQSTGSSNAYQWSFQGGSPAISSSLNPVITYSTPGTYSVILTLSNSIGTSTFSQVNYITVTPTVATSLSIGISNGNNTICAGANLSFTASSINGGSSPTYQWMVNGVNSGTNGSVFSTNALSNNATVNCVLTSNATCANPATLNSASLTIVVNSTVAAALNLAITGGNNPMCSNSSATFVASPFNGGNSPSYQWKKNNLNVGTNSATYSGSSFANNDVITCDLSSNASCASSTFASSAPITITISTLLTPSVSLGLQNGSNPACVGQQITYTAFPFSGGNAPTYLWLVNGNTVNVNSSLFTSTVSNGSQIQCVLLSNASCASPNTASSSVINMTVNPIPPIPSISLTGSNTICAGTTATLSSNATGASNWSNGSISNSIVVGTAGTYSLTQTINGCSSPFSSAITISVLPVTQASLDVVPDLCKDDASIVLNGSPAGGLFSGNGVNGNNFNPNSITTGSAQIIYQFNDTNGCNDTAAIAIRVSACTNISKNNFEKSNFSIFPNPANKKINIVCDEAEINFQLFDMLGNQLMQGSQKEIDITGLSSGLYFIKVETLETRGQQRLIIIND